LCGPLDLLPSGGSFEARGIDIVVMELRMRTQIALVLGVCFAGACDSGVGTVDSSPISDALVPGQEASSADGANVKKDGPAATKDHGAATSDHGGGTTSVTVVVAGDIAESGRTSYARTLAGLITKHSPTVSAVVLGGDNARDSLFYGLLKYYDDFYNPASEANWGQFDKIAFPQTGNHEYIETNAQGYFDYFATRMAVIKGLSTYHGYVDTVGKGYYSFDLNGWHFVSLNSNITHSSGSAQETWLKSDLSSHKTMPIIAVWHSPRYACGGSHASDTSMQTMWADLYDAGADFVFNGHNHYYQRWVPLNKTTPNAVADSTAGLTEVVVGSYGVSTYSVCTTVDSRVAKQAGGNSGIGAFFMTLSSDGKYTYEYVLANGTVYDSGSGQSHHHK
jgi:acid phosphatase type 7